MPMLGTAEVAADCRGQYAETYSAHNHALVHVKHSESIAKRNGSVRDPLLAFLVFRSGARRMDAEAIVDILEDDVRRTQGVGTHHVRPRVRQAVRHLIEQRRSNAASGLR